MTVVSVQIAREEHHANGCVGENDFLEGPGEKAITFEYKLSQSGHTG